MPCTIFNKCCFCIELRMGCFIIGYLELVLTVIAMVATIIKMAAAGAIIAAAAKMRALCDTEASTESACDAAAGNRTMVMTGFLLFFVLLTMAFVITFIVGLHQNKRAYIRAYFLYAHVALVIQLIIFAMVSIIQISSALFLIGYLTAILLHAYFLVVVRDYYVTMTYTSYPTIYSI